MKNTLLWGALFTLVCVQAQAEDTTQTTSTAQPNMPVQEQPANQPTTASIINCDYKIDASTKSIDQTLVLNWSEKATAQAFNFSPAALDDQMKKLQNCFTEQGWTGFNAALEKSGNLEAIKNQNLTVSSQVDGQVKMDEAKDNQWKLSLPLQVVYQNDKEKVTQLLDIKLTVSRKVSGDLGITQLIATPRSTVEVQATTPNTTSPAVTSPNDSTGQPTTTAPNGTPTTPTGATAPTEGNPEAVPSTTTDQQNPVETTNPQ